jgi:hypothetical protein
MTYGLLRDTSRSLKALPVFQFLISVTVPRAGRKTVRGRFTIALTVHPVPTCRDLFDYYSNHRALYVFMFVIVNVLMLVACANTKPKPI